MCEAWLGLGLGSGSGLGLGLGLGLGCEVARLQEHVRGVACAQGRAGPCEGRGRCKGVGDVCSMVIG